MPPGCYIWGAPEGTPDRIPNYEVQGPVTISRAFALMQYEVTVAQWEAQGREARFFPVNCQGPTCPATATTWFQALEYANELSLAHDPPLEPCYLLDECTASPLGYGCAVLEMAEDSVYDCTGYRLPTAAEWQYAARAGTTTTYYSGDITLTQREIDSAATSQDLVDPMLDPIAWYGGNSGEAGTLGGMSHPVGTRAPNRWNLYDMLGNAEEWVHDEFGTAHPEYPAADPFGQIGWVGATRWVVGGRAGSWPSIARASGGLPATADGRNGGFRLARTLPPQ